MLLLLQQIWRMTNHCATAAYFFMNCHISLYLLYNILHDMNVTTYLATLENFILYGYIYNINPKLKPTVSQSDHKTTMTKYYRELRSKDFIRFYIYIHRYTYTYIYIYMFCCLLAYLLLCFSACLLACLLALYWIYKLFMYVKSFFKLILLLLLLLMLFLVLLQLLQNILP